MELDDCAAIRANVNVWQVASVRTVRVQKAMGTISSPDMRAGGFEDAQIVAIAHAVKMNPMRTRRQISHIKLDENAVATLPGHNITDPFAVEPEHPSTRTFPIRSRIVRCLRHSGGTIVGRQSDVPIRRRRLPTGSQNQKA